ncbi:hypothetical protein AUK11_01820 [bacterium CG2_30_37_16]|nr:MAG: hypothetical protein AUK11_01820 [bacterium CG2_30_37_16]PIX99389.1 MAG: NUDIX hydrolase [bacterium (Candidatus Howlettbacteria) CG_4_10_14_3_um_filter_37_10]PJB07399.1 MAG: NUDIX hydrolase [bacterium (Candidatus Howlettbacteria) CG_4_9_14_3_um_filter_37_10]
MSDDKVKFDCIGVAVDIVIFNIIDNRLKVLLIKRAPKPENVWAIPGGFVRRGESLLTTAKRELDEETGVKDVYLEQLYTFGNPERDPRTRVVSVAYFALVNSEKLDIKTGSDAKDAAWRDIDEIPKLAFDHNKILDYSRQRLIWKLEYTNVAYSLLPRLFTLTELQRVYEAVVDRKLDKRNFRRKLLKTGLVKETTMTRPGAHRPAILHEFTSNKAEYISNPFGAFLKK